MPIIYVNDWLMINKYFRETKKKQKRKEEEEVEKKRKKSYFIDFW